jgi:hypothetical protein
MEVRISEHKSTSWVMEHNLPSGECMDITIYVTSGYHKEVAQMLLSDNVQEFLRKKANG